VAFASPGQSTRPGKTAPKCLEKFCGRSYQPPYIIDRLYRLIDSRTEKSYPSEQRSLSSQTTFEQMLAEVDFSGGYARLIKLAWHLFNEGGQLLPIELLHLDDKNFRVLSLRRSSRLPRSSWSALPWCLFCR
jgi:hypothetical protein